MCHIDIRLAALNTKLFSVTLSRVRHIYSSTISSNRHLGLRSKHDVPEVPVCPGSRKSRGHFRTVDTRASPLATQPSRELCGPSTSCSRNSICLSTDVVQRTSWIFSLSVAGMIFWCTSWRLSFGRFRLLRRSWGHAACLPFAVFIDVETPLPV